MKIILIAATLILLAIPAYAIEYGTAHGADDLQRVESAIANHMRNQWDGLKKTTKGRLCFCVCSGDRKKITYAYSVVSGSFSKGQAGSPINRVRQVCRNMAERCGGCYLSPASVHFQMVDGRVRKYR